jgi:predicted peptidase
MNRRDLLTLFGAMSAAPFVGRLPDALSLLTDAQKLGDSSPPLAPGTPASAQRRALIDAFREKSLGLETKFEARSFKSDWTMPYRLFRPNASGRLPLVVYLHGSGGLGTDNEKQMGLGNTFGTRVWALPENQKRFPCFVLAPQTDRGWMRYAEPAPGDSVAVLVPGLGEGARLAFALIDALRKELPIDDRRVYITGQSMGGGGAWHMVAHRPRFFAAAITCCGSASKEPGAAALGTPLWNFHGDADKTVPISVSRARVDALLKAGAHPISTEYAGVGHNVWEWAYTEPALPAWTFSHRRA